MNLEIIKDKIFYFKNAIKDPNKILKNISENSNDYISEWKPWGHFDNIDPNGNVYVRDFGFSKEIYGSKINENSELSESVKTILKAIDDACSIYAEKNNITHERKWKEDFSILQYHSAETNKEAAGLGPHLDHPDLTFLEEHTILVYYNDDYEGADLIFDKLGITIKPEAGSIIMFQSVDPEVLHSTSYLTQGTKYLTLHMWIDGPIKGFYR